jgi:thioredoxin 1
MSKEITEKNFVETISSEGVVLVDCWAQWCAPCRALIPIIDELSNEYEGKAIIGKLEVDANQAIANQYGIRSIPTILIFKGGKLVDTTVGAASKGALKAKLDKFL